MNFGLDKEVQGHRKGRKGFKWRKEERGKEKDKKEIESPFNRVKKRRMGKEKQKDKEKRIYW